MNDEPKNIVRRIPPKKKDKFSSIDATTMRLLKRIDKISKDPKADNKSILYAMQGIISLRKQIQSEQESAYKQERLDQGQPTEIGLNVELGESEIQRRIRERKELESQGESQ
jgi:hypothetical protein